MTNKRLELLNEFDVHVSPTVKGVGITIMGQETERWNNYIRGVDQNGDGEVTFEEFNQALDRIIHES